MIYAVGYTDKNPASVFDFSTTHGKQLIWIIAAIILLVLCFIIDWKFWRTFAYPIYGISTIFLILVLTPLGVVKKRGQFMAQFWCI